MLYKLELHAGPDLTDARPQARGNRIINCHMQTNQIRHNWNIWPNTWSMFFIRITSVFSYLFWKKNKHTAPIWYEWRHKDFKAQREDHVATRLPRL